jgi:prepilin-type N-terminal cleavage/methylation domain-containing protein
MRNKQKGFSLIELLIVVAIILIIAAIAIPNLLRSKIAANQASAVASLRTLNTSSVLYNTNYQQYPSKIADMATGASVTSTSADLIDSVLATGTKSGYNFSWSDGGTGKTVYEVWADPVSSSSGTVHYFTDQSLVIRSNSSNPATANDLAIGN